jgi:hypothetical protein
VLLLSAYEVLDFFLIHLAAGTLTTTVAPLLFALVVPSASYWAFGFPAAACIVVGTDFVFAAGTLFIAGVCAPEEQSVAGGVFQTMTQVGLVPWRVFHCVPIIHFVLADRNVAGRYGIDDRLQPGATARGSGPMR